MNQKIALRILEKLGYAVDIVKNGQEAILALRKQHYDLVLMDIQMPEMDGLEATRQIFQHWPPEQIPIIIAMTASEDEQDRKLCLEAGMNDYLTKPIQIEQLKNLLSQNLPHSGS